MKYKVAIIGCGRISYKHIEGFISVKDRVDVVALCDPSMDKMNDRVKQYSSVVSGSDVKCFTSYKEMLSSVDLDFVTIATESGTHRDITIDCLNAGVNVIVEKPMALSTKDADDMIECAKKNGLKLAVCFQNRFNGPIVKTREAFEKGRLGKLLHSSVQVRWNRNIDYYSQADWRGTWDIDGGTLMNQCTHGIDLLQWMNNSDVVKVHGVTRRFQRPIEAEDFGCAILEFADGSVGIVEGTANVYPKNLNESLSLFGTDGTVVIGGLAVNKFETWRLADSDKVGDTEDKVIDPNAKDPDSVYGKGHGALFADFIDALDNNREPLTNGAESKKALEIILAIYKSQKEGKPVELPIDFATTEMKGVFGE
ncbi:Gfo/Idh/MocA family oxidoreductase [Thiospirochaeta perfilievii]|uniref:Gfo/Idh/MocA family oxidoreductase n=1 Tax=Thiospirochaeta perfilievii TaxID=252967 RepID=A0A5C1QE15_9SPIO|nr:Gfo/Idh/MocA family oxidoreductase [Thiospirochaeta perfilievii]QEN05627.1 Gfo/Idh/MocA family oxidoreductase [Thiospirochaeta perfilievii]